MRKLEPPSGRGDEVGTCRRVRGPHPRSVPRRGLLGSTLFLVSAGLTLIFGVTRVVNFRPWRTLHAERLPRITFATALPATPFGFFGGVLLAALVVGAAGVIVEFIVLRRIYAAPEIFQLLATFDASLIIQDFVLAIWGPEEQFASSPA